MPDTVQVIRGRHDDPDMAFGPLPGRRIGNVVAYEFELPERFVPRPGRTRVERTSVLLDVGVFANPLWIPRRKPARGTSTSCRSSRTATASPSVISTSM